MNDLVRERVRVIEQGGKSKRNRNTPVRFDDLEEMDDTMERFAKQDLPEMTWKDFKEHYSEHIICPTYCGTRFSECPRITTGEGKKT